MGWISKKCHSTGRSLNPNCKNNGSDRGPLRKIISCTTLYIIEVFDNSVWKTRLQTDDYNRSREMLAKLRNECGWDNVKCMELPNCEQLECGHFQASRSDIFGLTAPVRRRCRKCKAGKPSDVN